MTPIRIIIADDHEIYREGLKMAIQKDPLLEIVAEADNGRQLVDYVEKYKPDIVFTDIIMPVMNGLEALKIIHEAHPTIGVIALSMFGEDGYIVDMLEAGAMGYLLKNVTEAEIHNAAKSVYAAQPYYCKSTTMKLSVLISKSRFNPYSQSTIYLRRKNKCGNRKPAFSKSAYH